MAMAAAVLCALAPWAAGAQAQVPPNPAGGGAPEASDLPEGGEESPELRALRLLEVEMFGPRQALVQAGESPWVRVGQVPGALTSDAPAAPEQAAEGGRDLAWLQGLALPDIPVRWDDRVVRYLEFYRSDPRGRNIMAGWLRRAQRYGPMVRAKLRELGLPEDLSYLAMIESGFDPTARSNAGAVGMWQFVRATGTEYGLGVDHWVDSRMDPERATVAGARYLEQLHRRFGSWELAFAAYNMGYGALLRAMRKFNTNDYWILAELEAGLPFETTFYVAKVMACALVGRNLTRFGYAEVEGDEPLTFARVDVPGGTRLSLIARAAGVDVDAIAALNPALRRNRTPAGTDTYSVRIPAARREAFARAWSRLRPRRPAHARYVVRFGETLEHIARRYRIGVGALRELNELAADARPGVGFDLLVPAVAPRDAEPEDERPVAAVPDRRFQLPDRRRVFYRVAPGDTLHDIARFFTVRVDDLREWNNVEPSAVLQRGLLLQLFVPSAVDLSRAVVLAEDEVRVLVVGSTEFFDYHESQRGRVRFRYTIRPGDSLTSIARRFELSVGSLARINRFSRSTPLQVGQEIVVYAPRERAPGAALRAADARIAAALDPATGDDAPAPAPAVMDDGDGEDEAADAAQPAGEAPPGAPEVNPVPGAGPPAASDDGAQGDHEAPGDDEDGVPGPEPAGDPA